MNSRVIRNNGNLGYTNVEKCYAWINFIFFIVQTTVEHITKSGLNLRDQKLGSRWRGVEKQPSRSCKHQYVNRVGIMTVEGRKSFCKKLNRSIYFSQFCLI